MISARERLWRLASRQHWVVNTRQLRALGFSGAAIRHLVRSRRLHPLHRGVFAVGNPRTTLRGDWLAAVMAVGSGAILSHGAAAALHDLREARGSLIDVSVAARARRSRRGIRVHSIQPLDPEDRTVIDGIPVTSASRTLLDLAAILDPTELRRCFERARRVGVLDLRAITRLLARSNGHRGVGRLRALLDYDAGPAAAARSGLEIDLIDLIREAGLPAPQANVLIDGTEVDCYWPDADLIVEVDSWRFHRERSSFEHDREKVAKLRLAGHEVLVLSDAQINDQPSWVVAAIGHYLG